MNIEVSGIYPANKGALLMLEAIRERIGEAWPDARVAVPLDWSAADRLRHGAWGTPGSLDRDIWLRILQGSPWKLREAAAFIPARQIDVLLDASGFAYGDFWGIDKLQRRLTGRLHKWKTADRRAILLPQALGPFTGTGMADAFRKAADKLDLIYVRDKRSMLYVNEVLASDPRIRLSPDFTNLLQPDLPERLSHLRGATLVIPNEKMVSGRGDKAYARYLDFLVGAIETLRRSGREASILLHEANQDARMADAVNARLNPAASVIDEPSALVTKSIIGAADLVVSSRFHGLVSALSSGVPALACGWSHKYLELMENYGCGEFAIDLDRQGTAGPFLSDFLQKAADPFFRRDLQDRARIEKEKTRTMWVDALALIGALNPS